ncbi:MAG: hypothetical protein XE05_0734 [Thermotogales bacterium 46_20]|nr:MAG: hypothetical protein XE05_0734 [Thermotogales bacterium 46_20]
MGYPVIGHSEQVTHPLVLPAELSHVPLRESLIRKDLSEACSRGAVDSFTYETYAPANYDIIF